MEIRSAWPCNDIPAPVIGGVVLYVLNFKVYIVLYSIYCKNNL